MEYNKNKNGCNRNKCPCKLWINCSYYVDIKKRDDKLKEKNDNNSIKEWYKDNFKIDYEMPQSIPNG